MTSELERKNFYYTFSAMVLKYLLKVHPIFYYPQDIAFEVVCIL